MLDEYKIDEKGPLNVNWNQEGWWTRIIVSALREAGIGRKSGKIK